MQLKGMLSIFILKVEWNELGSEFSTQEKNKYFLKSISSGLKKAWTSDGSLNEQQLQLRQSGQLVAEVRGDKG